MNFWRSCLLLLPVAAFAPLRAQTLELRSGEVVIGRVVEIGDKSVKIEVNYPSSEAREIARSDLLPWSVYTALASRIDKSDASVHLELAKTCRELGLSAAAIAEAREAQRRDPNLATMTKPLIEQLFEEIAARLIEQAQADFEDDRLGSADLAARLVQREYGDSKAAKAATDLLARIAARSSPKPRQVTTKEVESAVEQARRALERTEEDTNAPAHADMRAQRALQRGVARLEKAWGAINRMAVPPGEVDAADRLSRVQAAMRARLTDAYLVLGTLYLERQALSDADEWCNKACKLDPENAQLHRLHALILQAKVISGWYY